MFKMLFLSLSLFCRLTPPVHLASFMIISGMSKCLQPTLMPSGCKPEDELKIKNTFRDVWITKPSLLGYLTDLCQSQKLYCVVWCGYGIKYKKYSCIRIWKEAVITFAWRLSKTTETVYLLNASMVFFSSSNKPGDVFENGVSNFCYI
jgi:hypothetical protein